MRASLSCRIRAACVLLAAVVGPVASAALPSKPASRELLLSTNAIAFRSNASETAHVGAEVYIHRRDANHFRLAQFIETESGRPFALMAFPSSFGLSIKEGDDIVDLSIDFNMDQEGRRSLTYYSPKVKQTIQLPPAPLTSSEYEDANMKASPAQTRRRNRDRIQQQLQEDHRQEQKHHYAKMQTSPENPAMGIPLYADLKSRVSVKVQDACGQPVTSIDSLQLSCTPVRYAQAQDADENTSPYRGAPKWLWRATTEHPMQQTLPGVFTGACDTTSLAAAAGVHRACAERMRERGAGDGFAGLCRPLAAVLDTLRDARYKIAHVYGGDYVAVSRFLTAAQPAFAAYERACDLFRRDDVQQRVDVHLAAEECGYPPEIALEVRGKGVKQMLGSMSASQDELAATITASTGMPTSGCPPAPELRG